MASIFTRIILGIEPASFVYRDELVVAFLDVAPINPGHTLVVPTREVESFSDLDEVTLGRMFRVAGDIARALRAASLRCDGINLLLSDGTVAGQEVPHVHLHVLPRFDGDGFGWTLPAWTKVPPRAELDRLAEEIRAELVGSVPSD